MSLRIVGCPLSTDVAKALAASRQSTYARRMGTSPGDGRKVAQLRNDVDDIYDMLGGINATLDQHTATLDQHTATLHQHSATLSDHGAKLDHIIDILTSN
jgi:hypothetical protein